MTKAQWMSGLVAGLAGLALAAESPFSVSATLDSADNGLRLAVAFGVALGMGERFSLYGEMAHVDDFFMNFGARWNF